MVQALALLLILALALVTVAILLRVKSRLTFQQALYYAPLKILWRVHDKSIAEARRAEPPVIYVIAQQSRLDTALMLSLLPADTLHILDPGSAGSSWLEPWRALARTVAFNAEHVFISRRLVSHLKRRGRLAVYLPPIEDNASKRELSLYRAVARIAGRGDAQVVAIHVHGHRNPQAKVVRADAVHFGLFPKLVIVALPAIVLPPIALGNGGQSSDSPSELLIRRMREAAVRPEA